MMTEEEFLQHVDRSCCTLLDTDDMDERARLVEQIVLNRRLAFTVIMMLSEEISPAMLAPVAATGVLQ